MALEPVQLSRDERIRIAKGRIETQKTLIAKWTHRRDEGDCVPDRETLTKWIDQEAIALKAQEASLASLTRPGAAEAEA